MGNAGNLDLACRLGKGCLQLLQPEMSFNEESRTAAQALLMVFAGKCSDETANHILTGNVGCGLPRCWSVDDDNLVGRIDSIVVGWQAHISLFCTIGPAENCAA